MAKSIYQLICDHISGDVLDPAFSLPEEDSDPAALHFAEGARDGIFVYHMAHSGLTAAQSREMGKALRAAAGDRYEEAEALMAAWTRECNVARSINQMHKYVLDYADRLDAGKMFHNARSFMLFSANAECVKAGIALMELYDLDERTKEIIRRLGLCEEFTLFAVWNMNGWENGNQEIFSLAQKVHGWGRIHAVERLQPETDEICRWLLLEGVRNDVMPAYSALTCWYKAEAEKVLFGKPSAEEYKGLAAIIGGLLDEGPVLGISELANAEEVLARFVEITPDCDPGPEEYAVIDAVKQWAENQGGSFLAIAAACSRIL